MGNIRQLDVSEQFGGHLPRRALALSGIERNKRPLHMSKTSTSYRPDIDGLRAFAVLVVIAFHLGLHRLRGGFVGVDVFFVVSGFLICSLLYSDLESGRFSLGRFYERRIRRILPSLLLVLAVTTAAAAVVLLPSRLEDYAQSLVAAVLSFSNFHFWQNAGYFEAPAATRPLLHTWSLAVEEQFYLAFPLLLALLHRFNRSILISALAVLALVSLAVSAIGVFQNQSAAFYLPFSRAWELLLGALLALGAAPVLRGAWAHVVGVAGLMLIIGAVFLIEPSWPFPGLLALAPCLGTAMVIAAGRGGEGVVGRVLAFRPIVFIGLISYSLYLWHWPLIVLFKEATLQTTLSHIQQLEILAACFVLSLLSWLLVEGPARRAPAPRGFVFASAGVGAATLAAAAFALIAANGWPQRMPAHVAHLASYMDNVDLDRFRTGVCFIDSHHDDAQFQTSQCLRETPGKPTVLLMGDSHAAHLWRAMADALPDANVLQATASGCHPTLVHDQGAARCRRVMDYVFTRYLPTHHVDLVLLSADWTQSDTQAVRETLEWAGRENLNLIVLGPSMEYDVPLPVLLVRESLTGNPMVATHHRLASIAETDRALMQATAAYPGHYVSTYRILCPQDRCFELVRDGVPMQYDGDHFTPEGAGFMVRQLQHAGVFHAVTHG